MDKSSQETWLSVEEACEHLGISRCTWDKWLGKGTAPRAKRMPNGQLRIRVSWIDEWFEALPEAVR